MGFYYGVFLFVSASVYPVRNYWNILKHGHGAGCCHLASNQRNSPRKSPHSKWLPGTFSWTNIPTHFTQPFRQTCCDSSTFTFSLVITPFTIPHNVRNEGIPLWKAFNNLTMSALSHYFWRIPMSLCWSLVLCSSPMSLHSEVIMGTGWYSKKPNKSLRFIHTPPLGKSILTLHRKSHTPHQLYDKVS